MGKKSEWEEERIEFYSRKGRGIEEQRGENKSKRRISISQKLILWKKEMQERRDERK